MTQTPAELEAQADEILDDDAIQQATQQRTKPPAVLEGEATVRLVLDVEDVYTPQQAVEKFINEITRAGLDNLMYLVSDDEHVFHVDSGDLVDVVDDGEGGIRVVDYYLPDGLDDDEDEDEDEDEDDEDEDIAADEDAEDAEE